VLDSGGEKFQHIVLLHSDQQLSETSGDFVSVNIIAD
jgi:hypothetical protein